MPKIITPLLITSTLLLVCVCCKKNHLPATLPSITQEGKNTVGFSLNGEVWLPYYKCNLGANPCGEISARYGPPYGPNNIIAFQVARQRNGALSALTINSLFPITTIGNKYDSINIEFMGENSSGNNNEWSKSYIGPAGSFEITRLDSINKIISGIFSFTLFESNGSGRSIQITEGRFDFRMNACICSNH
jgi:hypothetical protein